MLNGNRNPECVAEHRIGSCKKLLNHSMADRLDKVMKMKDHSLNMKVFLNLDLTLKVLKLMHLKMYTKAAILKLIGSVQEYPTEPLDKIPALRAEFEPRGRGVGYCHIWAIGMCLCEGYGFQAVHSRIGYINQRVWV